MKDSIGKFGQGEIISLVDTLSSKNKTLLKKATILFNSTAGKSKSSEHKRAWIKLAYTFEKDMDKLNYEDGLELAGLLKNSKLSAPAKNELRIVFKRWIRDSGLYPKWSIDFQQLFRKSGPLKSESEVNRTKINSDNLVKDSEKLMLIQATPDLMWKCAIQLNSLLSARPGCEMLPLKFKDCNFEKQTIKIHSSKTGRDREIYIAEAMHLIQRWYEEYKYPNVTRNDFIFPSPRDRYKHLNLENYDNFLKNLSLKVLGRPVWPYLLRHSNLKQMQKELSPQVYAKYADHSINVASKFYSHMDTEDVTSELKGKIFKIKEIPKERQDEFEALKKKLEEEIRRREDFEKRFEAIELARKQGIIA